MVVPDLASHSESTLRVHVCVAVGAIRRPGRFIQTYAENQDLGRITQIWDICPTSPSLARLISAAEFRTKWGFI